MLLAILLSLAGLLVVAAVVLMLLGSRLPEEHTTTVSAEIGKPAAAVWEVMTDFAAQVGWAPGMKKVERLPDRDGKPTWRESFGPRPVVVTTTESVAPRRLVRTIVDDGGPFSGRWEYALDESSGTTRVTVTETGRIKSPIMRWFATKTFGLDYFLKRYLDALKKRMA